jgi:hypothetical protein
LNPILVAELASAAGLRQVKKKLRMWPSPEYASLFERV